MIFWDAIIKAVSGFVAGLLAFLAGKAKGHAEADNARLEAMAKTSNEAAKNEAEIKRSSDAELDERVNRWMQRDSD